MSRVIQQSGLERAGQRICFSYSVLMATDQYREGSDGQDILLTRQYSEAPCKMEGPCAAQRQAWFWEEWSRSIQRKLSYTYKNKHLYKILDV